MSLEVAKQPHILPTGPQLVPRKEVKEFLPNYNNIGVFHYKLFATDGISFEAQKIGKALTAMGRNVHWFSADAPAGQTDQADHHHRMEELSYQSEEMYRLNARIFRKKNDIDPVSKKVEGIVLKLEIESKAEKIKKEMNRQIDANAIGVVHVRNMFSLPFNLPATLALYEIMTERPELVFIMHHSDFVWEAERWKNWTSYYPEISSLIKKVCPPQVQGPTHQHIVISSIARDELYKRTGIEATVLPDSYDFNQPSPFEKFNPEQLLEMRRDLGIRDDELAIGAMTRIIPRKGIELTIQAAAAMNRRLKSRAMQEEIKRNGGSLPVFNGKITKDSQAVVVFTHQEDLKDNMDYFEALKRYAAHLGVKIIYAGDRVAASEGQAADGKKIYAFNDTYGAMNTVSFPSLHEGFGNQLHEIIGSLHNVVLFEYQVFLSDIKKKMKDLNFISFGSQAKKRPVRLYGFPLKYVFRNKVESVADSVLNLLKKPEEYRLKAKLNLELAKKYYGVGQISRSLNDILLAAEEAITSVA